MKTILRIALSVALIPAMLYFSTSCTKTPGTPPTACFTPSATTVLIGQQVNFTNCSISGTSFTWEFGDGATSTVSTLSDVTHAYTSPGTYTAKLTASNGQTSVKTVAITVISGPGLWTFKGSTIFAATCTMNVYSGMPFFRASPAGATVYDTIVTVSLGSLPSSTTTYTIVNAATYPLAATEAAVEYTCYQVGLGGPVNYFANSGQTLNASVVTGGKISVGGNNIQMYEDTVPSNTGTLTFQITQQ